ncbi:MAG: adenylate/guanylate cyclase domain-containing protein [Oscillochloris sp.]|nr:adenylate/guanylate cyclase domain-containing protein [Oscillochloris sp.]
MQRSNLAFDIATLPPNLSELLQRCLPVELAGLLQTPADLNSSAHDAIQSHLAAVRDALIASLPLWLVPPLLAGIHTPAEYRRGTLLFADVSGFTALSERLTRFGHAGVEQLIHALNDCFAALVGAVRDHGGDLLAFGGDAVLACFSGADHAATAAAAALAMQVRMASISRRVIGGHTHMLSVKIGLASGPLLLSGVGLPGRRLALALGSVIDHCDEVAANTAPGAIGLHESTAGLLAGRAEFALGTAGIAGLQGLSVTPELMPAPAFPPAAGVELLQQIGALAPYLPADVFATLAAAPGARPGEGEQRDVVSLFIHLAGLHALADQPDALPATLVAAVVTQVVGAAMAAIERYGGALAHCDSYNGGLKLLAFFGAPVARQHDAQRAVEAALQLRADLQALQVELSEHLARSLPNQELPSLQVRMGVNYGPVVAGLIGSTARREYTVIGSATNIAARLMGAADLAAAEILVGPSVCRQLGAVLRGEERLLGLKGLPAPLNARSLTAIDVAPLPAEIAAGPLFGRERELAQLSAAAAAIERGDPRLVFLQGEAGVGKTRLARELAERLANRVDCLFTRRRGWCRAPSRSFSRCCGRSPIILSRSPAI